VLHITDTLDAGGAERVAVNLVNLLPRDRYRSHLCSTRAEGLLSDLVAGDVGRVRLFRKHTCDVRAVMRLAAYIRQHRIEILHAHAASLFIGSLAALLPPRPALIWHDHFGRHAIERRPAWPYRLAVRKARGVIAVNESLMSWSRDRLGVPASRLWYVPNFVPPFEPGGHRLDLPGARGARIVCVANFRAQKDHLTLVRAMASVVEQVPAAQLLLVGESFEPDYLDNVRREISRRRLDVHVTVLGYRRDVAAVLRACDVGVLSSVSEGLPLTLLEYGMAGLPVVATRVGQCADVLDDGRAGILVNPGDADQLARELMDLLDSAERRAALGRALEERVRQDFSPGRAVAQVCRIYDQVLQSRATTGRRCAAGAYLEAGDRSRTPQGL
jgi:glycosyltransferase involved in cell wall biosynthesis